MTIRELDPTEVRSIEYVCDWPACRATHVQTSPWSWDGEGAAWRFVHLRGDRVATAAVYVALCPTHAKYEHFVKALIGAQSAIASAVQSANG